SLEKPFDGKFKDAVKLLSDTYDLPLVIDPSVHQVDGGMGMCDGADDKPVKLPRLLNVRVDTVLRLVCEQVGATYLIYPDTIKIVAAANGLYESGVLPITSAQDDD